MTELTISRADLVEIATEALAASEGITDEQKLEMCETAHTTKEILAGAWLTKDCGCLVGATYRERLGAHKGRMGPVIEESLGAPMRALGNDFECRLRARVGISARGPLPVTVIG